jgi:hypothetical protein
MADQDFYLQVEKEIASGIQDEAMLSKAKIMAEENGLSSNVNYTKLRVAKLKSNDRKETAAAVATFSIKTLKEFIQKALPFVLLFFLITFILAIQFNW